MKLEEGQRLAAELIELLQPACHRIEIAGSIRRGVERVRDIEIVAEPHIVESFPIYQPPPAETQRRLFELDDEVATAEPVKVSALNARVTSLCRINGHLDYEMKPQTGKRLGPPKPLRNGDRYKRLIFRCQPVDLFIVLPPAQWGPIMTIRTGPAGFSHVLVTSRRKGGAVPDHLRQQDGRLVDKHGRVLHTPSESQYFRALGVPCWKPQDRSLDRLRELLCQQSRS